MQTLSPELRSQLQDSHLPLIIQIGSTTLVGEKHIKISSDPLVEKDFQERLSRAAFIAIEHDCLKPNQYSQLSSYTRFMELAQIHSLQNRKQLLILDSEISHDRYLPWIGISITRDDFILGLGLHLALSSYANGDQSTLLNSQLISLYQNFYDDQVAVNMAIATQYSLFSKKQIDHINDKVNLVLNILKIDAQAREIYYQKRMQQIVANLRGRSLLAVFGKEHVKPIADTLDTGKYSKVDGNLVSQIKNGLNSIKRITRFPIT